MLTAATAIFRLNRRLRGCTRLTGRWLALCMTLAPVVSTAGELCSTTAINAARRAYDLAASETAFEACELEAPVRTDDAHRELVARAALLVCELYRIDFEDTPDGQPAIRRMLGEMIDNAADSGLHSLNGLPETSERLRLEADLLATKIRSDFRAKKYGKKMKAAATRALQLDPTNALAIVNQAKPFLFAEVRHGGDLEEAVRLLDESLAIAPGLERALLLRALAFERLGRPDASQRDLKTALKNNPQCRPAEQRLGNSAIPSPP